MRYELVSDIQKPIDATKLKLKDLFVFTVKDAIYFLVSMGLIRNTTTCEQCYAAMNLQERSDRPDGVQVLNAFL